MTRRRRSTDEETGLNTTRGRKEWERELERQYEERIIRDVPERSWPTEWGDSPSSLPSAPMGREAGERERMRREELEEER